jgi:PAS domain S-box-containing protein
MDISELLPSGSIEELLDGMPDGFAVTTTDGLVLAVNTRLCELSGYPRDALIGSWIETLIPRRFQAEHVALRSAYVGDGAPARSMSARSDIVLCTADNREVPVDVALSAITGADTPVVLAAVRDASARREAELAREREYRFVGAVNDITNELFTSGDIDRTFRAVTQQARLLLNADVAFLAVPREHDDDWLHLIAADGHGAASFENSRIPMSESVAGAVFRERQAMLLVDVGTDRRFHREAGWPDDLGPALTVPLHARDDILATITIANRRGASVFSASDVALISAFAAHAALALVDARNQETRRRLEVFEDRERVAAAMHDRAINRISQASLIAHVLLQSSHSDETVQRLWEIIGELDASITAIRDAVFPH